MPPKGDDIERYRELFTGVEKRVQLLFATQNIESFICREARHCALSHSGTVCLCVKTTRKQLVVISIIVHGRGS